MWRKMKDNEGNIGKGKGDWWGKKEKEYLERKKERKAID